MGEGRIGNGKPVQLVPVRRHDYSVPSPAQPDQRPDRTLVRPARRNADGVGGITTRSLVLTNEKGPAHRRLFSFGPLSFPVQRRGSAQLQWHSKGHWIPRLPQPPLGMTERLRLSYKYWPFPSFRAELLCEVEESRPIAHRSRLRVHNCRLTSVGDTPTGTCPGLAR